MKKRILGFTLIELLIVITIIGILAVVFIPNFLNAPAKARDVQRITDVNSIVRAIEAARLDNKLTLETAPAAGKLGSMCVTATAEPFSGVLKNSFTNGVVPKDPSSGNTAILSCGTGEYYVYVKPTSTTFKYAVFARVEVPGKNGNIVCPTAALIDVPGDPVAPSDDTTTATTCYFAKAM